MKELIRIVLVEDAPDSNTIMKSYLERFSAETEYVFEIKTYEDGVSFLQEYDYSADIILMDIDLPGQSGIETVRKLREQDKNVLIMFVTSLVHYAVEGYSVEAFDYIVKPVAYYEFLVKIKRALARVVSRRDKRLEIHLKGGVGKAFVFVSDIKYVEIMGHTLIYHTTNGNYSCYGSMKSICEELRNFPFALCNRCYLVNLRYVSGINQFEVMIGNETLQISHLKRAEFMKRLNYYHAGLKYE